MLPLEYANETSGPEMEVKLVTSTEYWRASTELNLRSNLGALGALDFATIA